MYIEIVAVSYLDDYRLQFTFSDGSVKAID